MAIHLSKRFIPSSQGQLNAVGILLLVLLALIAWDILLSHRPYAAIPLGCLVYVAFNIIFELTFNRANVPTLATGFAGRGRIAALLKHEAARRKNQGYTIIDMGSGRGELTRRIAAAIPEARVIGVEKARLAYKQAVIVQRLLRLKNVSYQCSDFWSCDCSGADAVVFYLMPTLMPKMGEKLYRELKPGSMIISHVFPLLGVWTPIETIHIRTPFKETIYVYRKD